MNSVKLLLLTCLGKFITWFSRTSNFGHGSTWPGHLALKIYPDILAFYCSQLKKGLILIAGTNGKTTTVKMTRTVLEKKGFKVIHNESGANLFNGTVSAFLLSGNLLGKIEADYGVFETDEATLPLVINSLCHAEFSSASNSNKILKQVQDDKFRLVVVLLNLFRDQLDRYGEVDIIARKWKETLLKLEEKNIVILNADDPQIAYLGNKLHAKTLYFGIDDKSKFLVKKEHATDSVYCPSCGTKLNYTGVYYSHLGVWYCSSCGLSRPLPNLSHWSSPLSGLYNLYNTLAAVLCSQSVGVLKEEIEEGLKDFQPAFGRQEEFKIDGKKVKIFLTKNPVSLNEAIRTIITSKGESLNNYSSSEARSSRPSASNNKKYKQLVVILALNDNIPDGTDVSWIWDVEFEELVPHCKNIICSGLRAFDMGLRIKYELYSVDDYSSNEVRSLKDSSLRQFGGSNNKFVVEENLEKAIKTGLENISNNEILYILPTYSAMLAVRKILSGKKIL